MKYQNKIRKESRGVKILVEQDFYNEAQNLIERDFHHKQEVSLNETDAFAHALLAALV